MRTRKAPLSCRICGGIVKVGVSDCDFAPVHGLAAVSSRSGQVQQNPANPRVPIGSDDSPDDSVDLERLRAFAAAAHALVTVDPERARDLLGELMRQLDAASRGQPT